MTGRLLQRVFKFISGLFIICFILLAYGNLPNRWYHNLYVYSGSMSPAIQPGDLILITPPPSILKPGMILTLSVNGSLVTHRLVGFGEYGELITKGDANTVVDDWGKSSISVVGIYRARIPHLGRLASLPGRLFTGITSGAWFAESESLSGELSAISHWATQPPHESRANLHGSLEASPYDEGGAAGVAIRLCVLNNSSSRLDDLHILNRILVSQDSGDFSHLHSEFLDVSAQPFLDLGEEHCYEARFPITRLEEAKYRDEVQVILHGPQAVVQSQTGSKNNLASSEENPVLVALELAADFELPAPPPPTSAPTLTSLPSLVSPSTVDVTPAGPAGTAVGMTPTPAPTFSPTTPPVSSSLNQPGTPTAAPTETFTPAPLPFLPATPTFAPTEEFTPAPTATATPSLTPKPALDCVYPAGYWLENPEVWPVDQFSVGDQELDQREARDLLLKTLQGDSGLKLAKALIVAKLNLSNGSYSAEAADQIIDVELWFNDHPLGSPLSDVESESAQSRAVRLDLYNQGQSGLPVCPSWIPTPTPNPTPVPTATAILPVPTLSPSSTASPIVAPETPTTLPPTPTAESTAEPASTATIAPDSIEIQPAPTPAQPPVEPLPEEPPAPTQEGSTSTPDLIHY